MGMSRLRQRMKEKKAAAHKRKRQTRDPYEVVLIVCEGEKTEPYYFEALRDELRLSSANILICGKECGSAPISVVDFALKEFRAHQDDYNRVFCIFDQDKHDSYDAAIDKIRATRLPNRATIHAITSIPCFEFWILLHFTYTTRSFCAAGRDSNCALVITQLKRHIPDYEKGNQNIVELVSDKTEDAIRNAKQLDTFHKTSGTDNPSTKVHELVEYLCKLKTGSSAVSW